MYKRQSQTPYLIILDPFDADISVQSILILSDDVGIKYLGQQHHRGARKNDKNDTPHSLKGRREKQTSGVGFLDEFDENR